MSDHNHHEPDDPATFGLFIALTRLDFERDEADDLTQRILAYRDGPKRGKTVKSVPKMLTLKQADDRYPSLFMKGSGKPKESAYKIAAELGRKIGKAWYIPEAKLDAYMEGSLR